MSSSNKPHRIDIAMPRIAKVAVFSLLLGLCGCIQPLYGPDAQGQSIVSEMQAVKIEPIPDRLGHYVENELIFAFNGTGSSPPPKYRLIVTLRERMATPVINTFTGLAEAGDVNVDADYKLLPIAGGSAPIASGNVSQFVVYDRTSQRLSNVRAARDAEIRNAKVIADQIRTRIAAALKTTSD
jgi:LPS-assembly lipoprotein